MRNLLFISLFAFLLVVTPCRAGMSPVEIDAAASAVQEAMTSLAEIDAGAGLDKVAVMPLEGDEGLEITDLVITGMTKSRYTVVLRSELEKVMEEHAFVMKREDLMDPATVKQLGGFLGVDGIIYGRVMDQQNDGTVATIRLSLKLANVETGELVWSEVVSGRAGEAPFNWGPVILGLVAVVVIALLGGLWMLMRKAARNRPSRLAKLTEKDTRMRDRMASGLEQSFNVLRDGREAAHKAGKAEIVKALRDSENRIDTLKMDIAHASYASVLEVVSRKKKVKDKKNADDLDRLLEFEENYETLLGDVRRAVDQAVSRAGDAGEEQAAAAIEELNGVVRRLKDKFNERKSILTRLA